jgi:hypothetical protein
MTEVSFFIQKDGIFLMVVSMQKLAAMAIEINQNNSKDAYKTT